MDVNLAIGATTAMTDGNAHSEQSQSPIQVDVAMYGGPRAGKTSLLASMYSAVVGEAKKAGLELRRANLSTIRTLDQAADALMGLPAAVRADPTAPSRGQGVETNPPGKVRRFDFFISGSGVEVATLRFYDFSGEDLAVHADIVREGLEQADIILIAINTPLMMEAYTNSDLHELHLRKNVPDQFNYLLDTWLGKAPLLVMFCPIKSERWLHNKEESRYLLSAIKAMYKETFNILARAKFADTTVVIAPVETVGAVRYDGYELYDPTQPPSHKNIVEKWAVDGLATWAPRYHEQPFRWALLAVTRAVDYGAIAAGKGGGWLQKFFAWTGDQWEQSGLPKLRRIEAFWNNVTGLNEFKEATSRLARGRLMDHPFEVIRNGILTRTEDA